jgi:hypothetical protein
VACLVVGGRLARRLLHFRSFLSLTPVGWQINKRA